MNAHQIANLRRRTAELSVGASTVRGAGAAGTVAAARRALARIPLEEFAVSSKTKFVRALDRQTLQVKASLPNRARHWGVARKVLNIFMRSCVYNRPLARAYAIAHLEPWLELPLDSQVARGLSTCSAVPVPMWRTVKGLSEGENRTYQEAAIALARRRSVHPIHLEACWWREAVNECRCGDLRTAVPERSTRRRVPASKP